VGLDGFTSDTVEQDGTAAWCGGSGDTTPIYKAWYEMYPANSYNVFSVQPGDLIDTSVDYAGGKFTLTVSDLSSHKSYTDVGTCSSCVRTSAEWIIERPAGCNRSETSCYLFALANFTSSIMSEDVAGTSGGAVQGIDSYANNYPLFMIQPLKKGFITLDTVGPVDETTQSFTATFDRSGQVTPITL
jgi:Peptidase A4 family